ASTDWVFGFTAICAGIGLLAVLPMHIQEHEVSPEDYANRLRIRGSDLIDFRALPPATVAFITAIGYSPVRSDERRVGDTNRDWSSDVCSSDLRLHRLGLWLHRHLCRYRLIGRPADAHPRTRSLPGRLRQQIAHPRFRSHRFQSPTSGYRCLHYRHRLLTGDDVSASRSFEPRHGQCGVTVLFHLRYCHDGDTATCRTVA